MLYYIYSVMYCIITMNNLRQGRLVQSGCDCVWKEKLHLPLAPSMKH